jgi:hypothetical protein
LDPNFRNLADSAAAILHFLETNMTTQSFLSGCYPWLAHAYTSPEWQASFLFVRPELEEILPSLLDAGTKLVPLLITRAIMNAPFSMSFEIVLMTGYILAWMSNHRGPPHDAPSKPWQFILESLTTILKISLSKFENIVKGYDLKPRSTDYLLVNLIVDTAVGRAILPVQYQNIERDINLQITGLIGTLTARFDHDKNCPCALIYHGVPDSVLRFFGFGHRESREWRNFVFGGVWCKSQSDLDVRITMERLVVFQTVLSRTLRAAFEHITKVQMQSGEHTALSREERVPKARFWRSMLLEIVVAAALRFFIIFDPKPGPQQLSPVVLASYDVTMTSLRKTIFDLVTTRKVAANVRASEAYQSHEDTECGPETHT